jgi:hypothetical protein
MPLMHWQVPVFNPISRIFWKKIDYVANGNIAHAEANDDDCDNK